MQRVVGGAENRVFGRVVRFRRPAVRTLCVLVLILACVFSWNPSCVLVPTRPSNPRWGVENDRTFFGLNFQISIFSKNVFFRKWRVRKSRAGDVCCARFGSVTWFYWSQPCFKKSGISGLAIVSEFERSFVTNPVTRCDNIKLVHRSLKKIRVTKSYEMWCVWEGGKTDLSKLRDLFLRSFTLNYCLVRLSAPKTCFIG